MNAQYSLSPNPISTTTLGSLCPDKFPPSTSISLYPANISSVLFEFDCAVVVLEVSVFSSFLFSFDKSLFLGYVSYLRDKYDIKTTTP
ncbi:MAG: hypothetical protein ACLRLW_13130, partial [Terrisporobacter sp.]|uniref:hypothetical protein n=1 Tax=Terrisporobacter sp. TaxID=1965305 RepID=UPI0039A3396E